MRIAMEWREFKILKDSTAQKNSPIYKGLRSVRFNDHNLKPHWISKIAKYSEFQLFRGQKEILVCIGESWTYGESLPGISTDLGRYSLTAQLEYAYGPRLAAMMNVDYYQYAVPGNCNMYMFTEVARILHYLKKMKYKKIYLSMQMTEPSREVSFAGSKHLKGHGIKRLYTDNPNDFRSWLKDYDEIFFEIYNNLIKSTPEIEIVPVLWKNFCSINTDKKYDFQIIDTSWLQYNARLQGVQLQAPQFYVVKWLEQMQQDFKNLRFDPVFINEELKKIEESNNFLSLNTMHFPHPNQYLHFMWAAYLGRTTGWVNGI